MGLASRPKKEVDRLSLYYAVSNASTDCVLCIAYSQNQSNRTTKTIGYGLQDKPSVLINDSNNTCLTRNFGRLVCDVEVPSFTLGDTQKDVSPNMFGFAGGSACDFSCFGPSALDICRARWGGSIREPLTSIFTSPANVSEGVGRIWDCYSGYG